MKKPLGYSYKLLSLLSTAGVAIAPAAMIGATSLLLAPATALAANECTPIAPTGTDPGDNGSTADSYVCSGSYSGTGITYSTNGNLTITGLNSHNVGTVGVNLTGNGSNSITWTQSSGTITGTGSGDSAFYVDSGTGGVTLNLQGVTGSSTDMIAAIDIESDNGTVNVTTDGTVNGRQYGIRVTQVTGNTTINANGSVSINGTDGVADIMVDKGTSTSSTTVNVGGTSGTVNGQSYTAIDLTSNGTQTVSISAGRTVSVISSSTTGAINLNGSGTRNITNNGTLSGGVGGLALVIDGGTNMTLNNNSGATLTGAIDVSGLTGTATVNNTGTWNATGTSTFNSGTNTLNNTGTLNVGTGGATFSALDTFNNSGTIALGDNTLTVDGGAFAASTGSLVSLNPGTGMLMLPGVTVSGTTGVLLTGSIASDTTVFSDDPIVLVDVTGGTTAEGDFVLDAGSVNYDGGIVRSPGSLFGYAVGYNGADQHVLFSVPTAGLYEYVPALQETISTWHTTADLVAARNADLRNERGRGLWIRLVGDRSERDFMPTFSSAGGDMTTDASYTTYTGAAIVGFDLLSDSTQSGDYNFGIHGGLVRTRMEFSNSQTTDDMDGVTVGVYGGLTKGLISVDGVVNANLLSLDHNEPINGDTSTNVLSLGGRLEAAYYWQLSPSFYVQPLLTAAYVRSSIDDLYPTNYIVDYDELDSARGAVGVRIGADAGTVLGPVGFWLTGRLWKEFMDESNVTFEPDGGGQYVFVDDMSGEFQELTGGVTLNAGPAEVFFSAGAKFYEHDEYDNYSGSIGVRWDW